MNMSESRETSYYLSRVCGSFVWARFHGKIWGTYPKCHLLNCASERCPKITGGYNMKNALNAEPLIMRPDQLRAGGVGDPDPCVSSHRKEDLDHRAESKIQS